MFPKYSANTPALTSLTKTFYLQAGEGTPQRNMPVGLLFARCIEVATDHANRLGIGFEHLIRSGHTWVLSRMSVEIVRMPQVNETYVITTWIESINRSMSERMFAITDADGNPRAYARSTWVVLNIAERTLGDLSAIIGNPDELIAADRAMPMAAARRQRPLSSDAPEIYGHTFKYCDLDSNLHVNTVRYIEMLLNANSPEFHAAHPLERLDVMFMRECTYGEHATLCATEPAPGAYEAEIRVQGEPRVRFQVKLKS